MSPPGPPRRRRLDHALRADLEGLPLLSRTPPAWASLAAGRLPEFLSDHAVCEQQAALTALQLVACYPGDAELVEAMTSLAAEEVHHLRRVLRLLHSRGLQPARRRPNRYVARLRDRIRREGEAWFKVDRLLVGALIEARSCERFTCLLHALKDSDGEVAELLSDLGPAEKRHWLTFHRLAAREVETRAFAARWKGWLAHERESIADAGVRPTVHG